ncbi:MAG: sigma-70 family RNA polymerase sigma factor [Oscillospiraceae bacterium]|nr:sigma-70 family RNA polymerase sigma factor [Oscillospiraceae bacterium]
MTDSLLRTNKDIEEIYAKYVDTIYRVCFLFMKNQADTEDALQATFIKLMERTVEFADEQHEKAWLICVASNICRNNLKHWFRKTIDISSLPLVDEALDPQIKTTVKRVLCLPDKYKTVIYMYYYEGYKTKEIAEILNKNESTVRSYLRIGRNLLKIDIGGEIYE